MQTIALLSDQLIDQIAAGEVIERPASVLKELLENAIDAGARVVTVSLEAGGAGRVEVTDDGSGMGPEDAALCLHRHATSKLRDAEGLSRIRTLGFRGEALAAIGSVSRVLVRTALRGASAGTEVRSDFGASPRVGAAAARPGTQVVVDDLFENVPARKKFLKRRETELRHCEDALLRMAVAHPEIAFSLLHVGKVLRILPAAPGAVSERIADALGPEVHPHLVPVDERRLGVRVHGVVASPEFTLSTTRGLYTYVNGRHVRDRAVHFALHRGLGSLLPPGRQPAGVLFIEVDASAVDVNVHPQKLEVRFADAQGVTEAVQSAVARALRHVPWLQTTGARPAADPHYAAAVERFLQRAAPGGGEATLLARDGPTPNDERAPGFLQSLRLHGVLAGRAPICESPDGRLVVLDGHALRERALAARLSAPAGGGGQGVLGAEVLRFALPEVDRVRQGLPALLELGLELEPFGVAEFRVRALPASLAGVEVTGLLRAALPHLGGSGRPAHEQRTALVAALACAAAGGLPLGVDEARALLGSPDAAHPTPGMIHPRLIAHDVSLAALLGSA